MTLSDRCWNCGSKDYINVAVKEDCPDCGIACCYRGGGPNEAYQNAMDRRDREYEAQQKAEYERYYEEEYGVPYR